MALYKDQTMWNISSELATLLAVLPACMLMFIFWLAQPGDALGGATSRSATTQAVATLTISGSYEDGKHIPPKYTGDGDDVSPLVKWNTMPAGVKEIAVVMDDPDAPVGTWDHWSVYKIPAATTELAEGVSSNRGKKHPTGMLEGKNTTGNIGYEGPQPPRGQTHRYIIRVFGLDSPLDVKAGLTKKELLKAMAGHIVAEGRLMGTYKSK